MTKLASTISSKTSIAKFDHNDWASAYCNVDEEIENEKIKPIRGEVPKDLLGTLYRNGPGKLERQGQWVHHPFDGDGMIVAIKFDKGQTTFSNRFVRTKAWNEEEKAGKFLYRGVFGTKKSGPKNKTERPRVNAKLSQVA